ncbi:MAG: signal peptide peptidase SppA [Blastomonas sp.]
MSFARSAWKILVAIKDGLVLLFMLMFFGLIFAALSARPNAAAVHEGALVLDLDGTIVEEPETVDPLAVLAGSQMPVRQFRLQDVLNGIKTASEDEDVKAIVLDLDGFLGGGQVALEQVSEALGKAKKKGKPVLAFATFYGDSAYLLASQASEIWVDPMGGAAFAGPGGSGLYYRGLMDELGVKAHVYRVGTYKSAVEPYLRSDQSAESKEALKAVLDPLWQNWLDAVKKARPKAKVAEFAADPSGVAEPAKGNFARLAVNLGIADKLGSRADFGKRVAKLAGIDDEDIPGSFKHSLLADWNAANAPDTPGDPIAVVTVAGTIVDGDAGPGTAGGDRIVDLLEQGLKRDDIKALVVRVDSPGGSAFASEQIRRSIEAYRARKIPVVISMANLAASGGYWVATAGDRILAEPSTVTGSIGVFAVIPSFEDALGKWGVNADGVRTTPLSGQPDIVGGFSPEVETLIQSGVENDYSQFLSLVAKARGKTPEQVDAIAQGRIWDGGSARQIGLVDRFGSLDDALAEAAKLAKIDGEFHPVFLRSEASGFEAFLNDAFKPKPQGRKARGMIAQLAWQQQAVMAQIFGDMQMMLGGVGVQARCLECQSLVPASGAPQGMSWIRALIGD